MLKERHWFALLLTLLWLGSLHMHNSTLLCLLQTAVLVHKRAAPISEPLVKHTLLSQQQSMVASFASTQRCRGYKHA